MALAPITEKQWKRVKEDINFDDVQMQKKTEQVKDWVKKQPHLPQVPDDILDKMIPCFLIGTKMSTERVKYKIDTYYAMRHQLPEIFHNRDPTQQEVRDSLDTICVHPLSELTPDGVRVNVVCFTSSKGRRFTTRDMMGLYKRVMALFDARTLQGEVCRGEYVVFDCRGFHLSHVTEVPWMFAQKFSAILQEGQPVRVRGIFLINAPGYIETIVNIVKAAFKDKIKKRIHIFQGDHTQLYKYIPQRILPSDFGGEAPSIEVSNRAWQNTLESMRDFFVEDEKRKTDESKRPRGSVNEWGQMFGINGSFSKLNID